MYIPIEIRYTIHLTEEQYKALQEKYETATKNWPDGHRRPEFEDFVNTCASFGGLDHINRNASVFAKAAKKGAEEDG